MIYKFLSALIPLLLTASALAKDPAELVAARQAFARDGAKGGEPARLAYVEQLAKLLEPHIARFVKTGERDDGATAAIEAELGRHPAPAATDGAALAKILPGKWQTPRHTFLYQADGSFHLLPLDMDGGTNRWKIKANEYLDNVSLEPSKWSRYTIILLNEKHFVYRDKDAVFFLYRVGK